MIVKFEINKFLISFLLFLQSSYSKSNIKNNIKVVLNNCNEYIKFLDDKTNELLKEPTNELRLEIWKYFANNNIDIINTDNNNGINEEGYIAHLFAIFDNNQIFCILENKTSYCKLCGTKISLPWLYRKSLFSISSDDINSKS